MAWHEAIIWAKAVQLVNEPAGINFGEILIKMQKFSYRMTDLKMPSAKLYWVSASLC